MADIVKFYPRNAAENPDNVLEQALGVYEDVFVIGFDKDGELDVRASMGLSAGEILIMLEKFKHNFLNGDYLEDGDA